MWRSGAWRKRRQGALAEMVSTAVRTHRYDAPWEAAPQVWEFFGNEGDVLRELQQEWRTALAGAIYTAIDAGDGDLRSDVMKAYERVQRRHRGVRQILEAHADHPAIASAMRKERALLSSFAGLLADTARPAVAAA
jgi:hypothetical protein